VRPIRFGLAHRQLLGMHHEAAPGSARRGRVLICPPFGQEAIRSYRMLRVLADRLARAGYDVLRFDYFGTGDSMGDDEEASLSGWIEDIASAQAELAASSPAGTVAWIGLRLGATAAWLAATQASTPPDRLILCEPVLDGPAYLRTLALAHDANQAANYSLAAWRPPAPPAGTVFDAVGFDMGRIIHEELASLSIRPSPPPRGTRTVLVLTASEAPDAPEWPGVETIRVSGRFEWTSEEALNTALVPAEFISALAGAATDDS
jgi:pimeloyl-ACP methyl ester carboxylesterase